MARFWLAIRVFFRILTDSDFFHRVQQLAEPPATAQIEPSRETSPAPMPAKPATSTRSQALDLLAALQREARLIDFLKEPIAAYSDAQIGAAVRDVHRDSAAALERMFSLKPVMEQAEGSTVEVGGSDAARVRLTGNVSGAPPHRGVLRHQGWQASKLELPAWSGSEVSALIVASAEVELR
jgi:hypothetical protein